MPAVCDQANFEPARQKRLVAGRTAGQQDERGTMSVMPCAIIRTDVAFDPNDTAVKVRREMETAFGRRNVAEPAVL